MNHFDRLIHMYRSAPIHNFYEGITMVLEKERAEIELNIDERYFHAGMSAHGSVYFKLLDDSAYFACQTLVDDYFLVTSNFSVSLLRPIRQGKVKAIGTVDFNALNICTASSRLYDEKGRLCATGHGQFVKSKLSLDSVPAYLPL